MMLLIPLASCSGSASDSYSGNAYKEAAMDEDGYYADNYPEEIEDGSASASASSGKTDKASTVAGVQDSEKLVYTCDMSVETIDYKKTMADIEEKIKTYKGLTVYKTEEDSNRNWYDSSYTKSSGTLFSSITVMIPAADFNAFLAEIEETGKVTSKSMSVENISSQYHDVQTKIEALEIQQQRLLEMLKSAENVEDMLAIETRLTEVETELNTLKTDKSGMDLKTQYSTVTINVREVVEYTKEGTTVKTNTFWDRLKNTCSDAWQSFLDILEGLLFFIISALPILVVLGVIALIIILIVKACIKKSRKKHKNVKPNMYYNQYQPAQMQNFQNQAKPTEMTGERSVNTNDVSDDKKAE